MSRKWIGPLAVLAMIVATLAAWESLPTRVPMHWGLSGEVDGWGSRSSLFIMPALAAGMWALFALLIRIGPREGSLDRTRETWWLIANVSILLLLGLHLVMMGAALGWPLDVSRLVLSGTGLTLAITGNYLPRLRPNWWMGIRTPWTLESDEVWRETH